MLAGNLLFARDAQAKADGIDDPANTVRGNLAVHDLFDTVKPLCAILTRRIRGQCSLRLTVKERRRRAHDCLTAAIAAAAVVVEHDSLHRLIPHFFPVSFSLTRMSM